MEFDILNIIFLLIEPESVMNIKSSLTPLKMQWVLSRFPGGQTQCLSEVDSAFEWLLVHMRLYSSFSKIGKVFDGGIGDTF